MELEIVEEENVVEEFVELKRFSITQKKTK
jgi:hypothetical protein